MSYVDIGAGSSPEGYTIANSAEAKGYIAVEPFHYKRLLEWLKKEKTPTTLKTSFS